MSRDETILEQIGRGTLPVYSPCGGNGSCGKCRVVVKGPCSGLTATEREVLSPEERERGVRLACQTFALGDVEACWDDGLNRNDSKRLLGQGDAARLDPLFRQECVTLRRPTLENGHSLSDVLRQAVGPREVALGALRSLSAAAVFSPEWTVLDCDGAILDAAPGRDPAPLFGVAVDIGTTTVACYLTDLTTGRLAAVASGQNAQCSVGADVISRIQFTLETETGLADLRRKILETLDGLIGRMLQEQDIEPSAVMQCVLVGNTTMHHIFWGLGCRSLAGMPFHAVTLDLMEADAGTVGLTRVNPLARVFFLPGIAGFVGSDTTGAMLAAGLEQARDTGLLLDLGTNGEIVLWQGSMRYACSTAAGPAFEGARIRHGMQAFAGAIDAAKVADDLCVTTVGGAPPRGICGSGLVSLVSELCKAGVIGRDGKIAEPSRIARPKLAARVVQNGRRKEIVIAQPATGSDGGIVLTQNDIRELQLAKGAIRAGIHILLKVAGLAVHDVDRVLLAGAFGNFIDKGSARDIGILPDIDLDKIFPVGNAAGDGARMALCDRHALKSASVALASGTRHVDLSSHPDFQAEFVAGMTLA